MLTPQPLFSSFHKRLLSLAMLALLSLGSFSQGLQFQSVTTKDGLSQGTVNSIVQDQNGYIWVGTDDGLNRYNGQSCTIFKQDRDDETSLADNEIEKLFVDDFGVLWVGTANGGLSAFDEDLETFQRFQTNPDDPNTLSSNNITSIIRNDEQTIWVGTSNGLNLFHVTEHKNLRYTSGDGGHVSSMPDDNIRCLLTDNSGLLWIGTFEAGLISYNEESSEFQQYMADVEPYDFAYSNRIRCLYEDSRGNFWVGKDGGHLSLFDRDSLYEYVFEAHTEDLGALSNSRVTDIHEDSYGTLWVGTENGLNIFDFETNAFKVLRNDEYNSNSLSNNYIRCLFEDEGKTIWIGTNTAGINTYHGITNKFNHFKREVHSNYSLTSNLVLAFAEDINGMLWVGNFENGLSAFDRENRVAYHYPHLLNKTHSKILTIVAASDSLIWFGTWGGGINSFNPMTQEFGEPYKTNNSDLSDKDVTSITEAEDGTLWLSTYGGGVNRFDPDAGTFDIYDAEWGLVSNYVFDLMFDSKGRLWIGTKEGLNLYDMEEGTIALYAKTEDGKGLSNNTINCLYEDRTGGIWLGTKYGLNRLDVETGEITVIHESDGLAGDIVYGILEDEEHNLWVSTTNGLSKFSYRDFDNSGQAAFKNYSSTDGLQDNEFNQNAYYRSASGELYFGGVNGFNHFYPKDITDNSHIPNVVLTSFQIYGREVPLDTAIGQKQFIELSYRDNFFSFEFASLDFISPEKNQYSYKMEGLDPDWSVPSNRPFANYTNLSGGDYIFRVRGSNNDGVWNEAGVKLHIRIIPPFYQTTWFYILCVIVSLLSVAVFVRVREAKSKREKKTLEEKVVQRTAELAQKNQDILDSINYARRIQEAILPERRHIFDHLEDAFILYLPKDIVSGDFYWFAKKGSKKIIAAVDCTGHGVPGAFMSMIGNNLLNQIVMENGETDPGRILELLNKGVQRALKQGEGQQDTNDGMDVAMCVIDSDTDELHFAGAYRPLFMVNANEIAKTSGDKYPIGGAHMQLDRTFHTQTQKISKGDCFYIFSDGYPDQFGGPKGKKFMGKRFQQLILDVCELPMQEQKTHFEEALRAWAADYGQVDDILVIGVRY